MNRAILLLVIPLLVFSGTSSSPAQEVEYLSSTLWTGVYDLVVVGDTAYCSFVNGLGILDLSDPESLTVVSQFYLQGEGNGIFLDGQYVYLADGRSGLRILDISDPSHLPAGQTFDRTAGGPKEEIPQGGGPRPVEHRIQGGGDQPPAGYLFQVYGDLLDYTHFRTPFLQA